MTPQEASRFIIDWFGVALMTVFLGGILISWVKNYFK